MPLRARVPRVYPLIPTLFSLLALIVVTPSCVLREQPTQRAFPTTDPVRSGPRSADSADTPGDANPDDLRQATEGGWTTDAWVEDTLGQGPDDDFGDETGADEATTDSPLDELAEVDPDVTRESLEAGRALTGDALTFLDFPIELNDQVLSWVNLYTGRFRRSCETNLNRSGRYIEMFRRIFAEEGVPQDLVYMAHVESGYKTSAYSRAHAKGIFQFIAPTARRYGLRVDGWVDERSDPEKSARAAAAYMKKLYADFGDWHLALAAYNAGEGKIGRALARSGARDFWGIAQTPHIMRETKNHVPAVIAAALISKQPELYGITPAPEPPLFYDTLRVSGAVDLQVLARCAGTNVATLRELNPHLRRHQTPPDGTTEVRVPAGTGALAESALSQVPPDQRVLYLTHRVVRGDTLGRIASRHGIGVAALQATNGLGKRTTIHPGTVLRIPRGGASVEPERGRRETGEQAARSPATVNYRVKRGDTLSGLAQRHATTPEAIAKSSNLSKLRPLRVGERLKIVPGGAIQRRPRAADRPTSVVGSAERSVAGRLTHTVRPGDTLWKIATAYRTSVDTLCNLNELVPSSVIHPGTQLTIGLR